MAIEAGIRLTAKNETTKAFQEFERQGRKSAVSVAQQFEIANRAMRNTGIALTGFSAAGSALIVKSTLLAARVETLGVVMNQVGKTAGFSSDQMADFEKGVRDMGITTQVARISLVRLIQANIDLKNASKLARTAQDAAVIAGINSSEAFERIVQGIQTLNPRILKTMGLTINLDQAYREYSRTMNIAVEDIDFVTKKQIAVNEVLEAGSRIVGTYEAAMDTAGKRMFSLARLAEEAQKSFGEAFLPAFVLVIDAATVALKAFNGLNPKVQQLASFSIAAGTAITGLIGPLLILASQGPKILGSLSAVGMTFFDLGVNARALGTGAGFLTTKLGFLAPALGSLLVAAAAAAAIVALSIAIGALVVFVTDLNNKQKTLVDLTKEHEQELRKAGVSFEKYDKEMRRVIRDVGLFNLGAREFSKLMRRGGEEAVAAALDIKFFGERTFEGMQKAETATDGWRTALERATTVEGLAETQNEGFVASAERLKRELEDLTFVMGVNVTEAFGDYSDQVGDLRDKQGDLIKGIGELSGQEWLTDKQREELSGMRSELVDINAAIVTETKSWEKNTASIIFNMAQRVLSQLTVGLEGAALQEAIGVQAEALGALALEFGLVDQAGARAFTQITEWSTMLANEQITLAEYLALVNGLRDGLNSLKSKNIDINLRYRVSGSPGGSPFSTFTEKEVQQGAGTVTTPGGAVAGQHGGFLPTGVGKPVLIGEVGEELLLPVKGGFLVVPAGPTQKMMRAGIRPNSRLAHGGFAFDSDTISQITGSSQAFSFSQARQITQQTVGAAQRAAAVGGGSTAPPLAQTAAAIVSSVGTVATAAAEQTASAISQATAGLGALMVNSVRLQTEQFMATIREQNLSSEQIRLLLEDIKQALKDQGTAFDMAQAVNEGLQTADFAS